jgi:hypothetical protein
MKVIKIVLIVFLLNTSCLFLKKEGSHRGKVFTLRNDTISGFFLYEVNVPDLCFSRFDQIEESNRLIIYDNNIRAQPIDRLYKKGVFYLDYARPIENYILNNRKSLTQNKIALNTFLTIISPFRHLNEEGYKKGLIFDKTNTLSYKKVYMKFVCIRLEKNFVMIPKTIDYKCCFSAEEKYLDLYFIKDILAYTIY